MIKITNTEVVGWEAAIRGMRNPMNSWNKSDSLFIPAQFCDEDETWTLQEKCGGYAPIIKENDSKLMASLAHGGPVHAKFRRMITVYVDIEAPLYWWKEYDTYKVGTVANSCSTMHKIHSKPIELDDFSIDDFHLDECGLDLRDMFINVVADCEHLRNAFLTASANAKKEDCFTEAERKHFSRQAKRYWKGLIQLLPTSYNQKRTIMLNYEVLVNIYHSRKNHKLDEWHRVCEWIESLPYSWLITGKEEENA